MNNKSDLIKRISVVAALFGLYGLPKFHTKLVIVFIVIVFFVAIVYIVECIKNKYSKVSIIVSILTLFMAAGLLIHELTLNNLDMQKYQIYIAIFEVIIVLLIIIVSGVNYIKISNKRNALLAKISLVIMFVGIIAVIILALLPEQ
ncbi:hypothetical protein IAI10_24205 [Clostridium sp. 19966]|uniref:hypothetical protein n=1 Tax=Clostridium sp. 19966 TaxID=2768166 RepID=UPI0028DE3B11|nr:hypothetical protein [Clostridium sp. 19966]MDT8719736.1 hypothetical protein [Clostridium sp. 19966]